MSGRSRDAGYKVNLIIHGDQLLTYGSSAAGLGVSGVDQQTGKTGWYRQYSAFPRIAVATTDTRPVQLMVSRPDGNIIVAGASKHRGGYFETVVLKYGRGPSVAKPWTDWVLPTRAQLRATASGNNSPSEVFWEYGLTTAYGSSTPRQNIDEGWKPFPPTYRTIIEGLMENTLYHARAVTVSARGTTVTADFIFTTAVVVTENETEFTAREEFPLGTPDPRFLRLRATPE